MEKETPKAPPADPTKEEVRTSLKFSAGYDRLPEVADRASFKKAVQIVHSYPVGGAEMTALDRRVLNGICVIVQDAFTGLSEAHKQMILDPEIRATPIFKTTITKVGKLIQHKSTDVGRIYESLRRLMAWEFCLNVMEDRDGVSKVVQKIYRHLLTELQIGETDGLRNGEIGFEIPNSTLAMVLEPFPFTQIEMAIGNSVKSSPTIALYENTYRYITTASKHTGILPVDEWIAILCGEGRYANKYVDFKRYVLKPAMELIGITESIPYKLELIEKFGPRKKVVALQFKLAMKEQGSLGLETPPPTWPKQLLELLRDVYRFTRTEVRELSHICTEHELQEACRREAMQFSKKKEEGNPVRDRKRYLKGVLTNLQTGKPKGAEPDEDFDDEPAEVKLRVAASSEQELRQEFKSFQISIAKEKIASMSSYELAGARERFALENESNRTVQGWIDAGWDNAKAGLTTTFASWLIAQVDWIGRILTQEHEVSFDAWNEKRFASLSLDKK